MHPQLHEIDISFVNVPVCHTVYRVSPWNYGIARQQEIDPTLNIYTLKLVTEGSLIVRYRDCTPMTVPANTLSLKKLTTDPFDHISDGLPFRYYLIHFVTREPLPLDFSPNTTLLAPLSDRQETERMFKEIYTIQLRKAPGWRVHARSITLELIWTFISAYAELSMQKDASDSMPEFLDDALKIIKEEAFDPCLTVNGIASRCHVSVEHLIRVFCQHKGVTPKQYINTLKIDKICEYLRFTDKKLEEITEITGFSDTAQMRRLFKAKTGMTPQAYRKKYTYSF